MPLFEYVCIRCGNSFEKLVRSSETQEIVCPKCQSKRVQKQMSSFAARGGTNQGAGTSAGSCAPGGG